MQEYRKTATVFARKIRPGEQVQVYSLEGPAVGKPGDYLLKANTPLGESWICRGDVFEATYELVGPGDAAPDS
jgi:hypothetical protein